MVLVDYAAEPARPPRRRRDPAAPSARSPATRWARTRSATSGAQDLTATVDLAAVRSAAARAGLIAIGETTQAELLAAVGTADLTSMPTCAAPAPPSRTRSLSGRRVARLMDPRGMGGFRVLVFGRGLPGGLALPALERVTRPRAQLTRRRAMAPVASSPHAPPPRSTIICP